MPFFQNYHSYIEGSELCFASRAVLTGRIFLIQTHKGNVTMPMLKLTDFLIWDEEMTPTSVPEIILPDTYHTLNDDDQWIQVGKYKVKIIVEKDPNEGVLHIASNGTLINSESAHGSMFFDLSSVIVKPADGANIFGSASGCFNFTW